MKIQENGAYWDLIKTLKFIFTVQWAHQCETFSIGEKGMDGLTDLRQFAYEIEIVNSNCKQSKIKGTSTKSKRIETTIQISNQLEYIL